MTRINLIRQVVVRSRSTGRVDYSWLVYRWTRVLVPGAGWINSYRQEIPETYHRANMRPRLRRPA